MGSSYISTRETTSGSNSLSQSLLEFGRETVPIQTLEFMERNDVLEVTADKTFKEWLSSNEFVILSAHCKVKGKKKKFVITNKYLMYCSDRRPVENNCIRGEMWRIDDLDGICLSLIKGQLNFVIYLYEKPSFEIEAFESNTRL